MNTDRTLRPTTPALPATVGDWKRVIKTQRTINDEVEDIHLSLLDHPDEEIRNRYTDLLSAVWDDEAVEGSQACDNYLASQMIRDAAKAQSETNILVGKKLATISKSLGVVLRRYGQDRPTRRNMVHGEIVRNPNPGEQSNNG